MSGEGDSGLVERLRERLAVWDAANYEVLTTIQVDVADVREAADEIERLTGTLVLVPEEVTIEQRVRDSLWVRNAALTEALPETRDP